MRSIIWFKKDLRIKDNPALYHACKQSTQGVIGVYILDQNLWQKCHTSQTQIAFIIEGLKTLAADLAKLGIPLIVKSITRTADTQKEILALIHNHQVNALFYNLEYEYYEKNRDQAVENLLTINQITVKRYDSQFILPPELILTSKPEGYKVFTAFKRCWIEKFHTQAKIALLPIPSNTKKLKINKPNIPSIQSIVTWPAGESIARKQLRFFIKKKLQHYDTERDFPYLANTSQLSPYLATGMISARECFLAALEFNQGEIETGNKGAITWMSELIWREFYRHVLLTNPHISRGKPFKMQTDKLPWQYDQKLLKAWQEGKTGFPIVDAAMRQLNTTGWMHNRLRMIVAMFLSKNLFLDWRLGERYFEEKLIDVDFASNNGGWQWCASTGTDAVPYFRLFNPTTQSKHFDPEGVFIRKFCPELKNCETRFIHEPSKSKQQFNYPKPIIDYAKSRQRILAAFRKIF